MLLRLDSKDSLLPSLYIPPCFLQSPVRTRTPTMYLDFKLDPGATMTQPVTEGWNGFIYVLKGVGKFGGGESWTESDAHHTLVLGPGDHVQAENTVSLDHCVNVRV